MTARPPVRLLFHPVALLALALACGGGQSGPAPAPQPAPRRPVQVLHPLVTPAIAGQQVSVFPLTILVSDDTLLTQQPLADHAQALHWADSLIGAALQSRSPEVLWILPPELRKIARRAAGLATDPDHMGHAVLRSTKLNEIPDPLRSQMRGLVALAGGRFALVPAALSFTAEPGIGLRAELSMALADTRTGKVGWRTVATGFGATPLNALKAALEALIPLNLS